MKKNLAVFISGNGSNLSVFLKNKEKFNNVFVVSSNSKAYGLVRAKEYNVESIELSSSIDWSGLNQCLQRKTIDMIFLAGFMKIIPASFLENWKGKIFNLHPSLLPKYKGKNAIRQAYDSKDEVGVTIHHVIADIDAGEIVMQQKALTNLEVQAQTYEEVESMTHKIEHQLVQGWIDSVFES